MKEHEAFFLKRQNFVFSIAAGSISFVFCFRLNIFTGKISFCCTFRGQGVGGGSGPLILIYPSSVFFFFFLVKTCKEIT